MSRTGFRFHAIAPVLLLAAFLPLSALATDYAELFGDLEREILRTMRGEDVAGFGIALVDGEELVWLKSFGYADAKARTPLTTGTPMAVGDFAKLLTTIAILQLAEADRLSLDDPVTRHVPVRFDARDPDWRAPTIRELLTHHAGLPPNVFAGCFTPLAPETLWLPDPVPMAQAPGTIYAYSQLGFQLAAAVVEAVAEAPFTEVIGERVTGPLELERTGFDPTPETARPHDKRRRVKDPLYSRDLAALGLFSSIEDLGKLLRWVTRGQGKPLLGDASVAEMTRVQNADVHLDLDNRAGLGWQLTNTTNEGIDRILRLNSGIFWHRGLMLVAPDQQLGVVVITNSSAAGGMTWDIATAALDGMLERKAGIEPPPEERPLPEQLDPPRGATAAAMASRYATPLGELLVEGGPEKFELELAGRTFGARRRADGWHEISFKLFGVISLRFSVLTEVLIRPAMLGGHDVLLAHFRGSDLLLGTAMRDAPAAADLADWAGEYRIANPDPITVNLEIEEARLRIEDDRLYLEYEVPGVVTLEPRVPLIPFARSGGEIRLYVPGLGINSGDVLTLRRDRGRREFEFSGWRLVQAN